jgi:integrase
MGERRHFGYVRRRNSGRWQATYRHEGQLHNVGTFDRKADALAALAEIETTIRRGKWIDPSLGDRLLTDYANEWLDHRPDLAVRTVETYGYLLDKHILPTLGFMNLSAISPSDVRTWNARSARQHPSTAAKAYRLLATIMKTAVTDELISTSPCRIRGASQERAPERPTASVQEIQELRRHMPEHLRVAVDLAVWCQLRKAEILGLQERDIDFKRGVIRIERSRTYLTNGKDIIKEPKTAAGRRELAVPDPVLHALRARVAGAPLTTGEAYVLRDASGKPISQASLQRAWGKARSAVGREDLHFHDLRHTGLTIAAATGATAAELMHRAGHASAEAAIRYQHASKDRDRLLADRLTSWNIDSSRCSDRARQGTRA